MSDPLKPSLILLMKLGSIAVHADEFLGPHGHEYDKVAIQALLNDAEVSEWIKQMGVYMPAKRNK